MEEKTESWKIFEPDKSSAYMNVTHLASCAKVELKLQSKGPCVESPANAGDSLLNLMRLTWTKTGRSFHSQQSACRNSFDTGPKR